LKPEDHNGKPRGEQLSAGYRQSNRLLWTVGLMVLPLVLVWFVGVLIYEVAVSFLGRNGASQSAGASR
jgi:hypothetical protein